MGAGIRVWLTHPKPLTGSPDTWNFSTRENGYVAKRGVPAPQAGTALPSEILGLRGLTHPGPLLRICSRSGSGSFGVSGRGKAGWPLLYFCLQDGQWGTPGRNDIDAPLCWGTGWESRLT